MDVPSYGTVLYIRYGVYGFLWCVLIGGRICSACLRQRQGRSRIRTDSQSRSLTRPWIGSTDYSIQACRNRSCNKEFNNARLQSDTIPTYAVSLNAASSCDALYEHSCLQSLHLLGLYSCLSCLSFLPLVTITVAYVRNISYQVARKQEVGDALFDGVLVSAVATHQLALRDLSLQQQMVQVLEHRLVGLQLFLRGGLLRQLREAELSVQKHTRRVSDALTLNSTVTGKTTGEDAA